MNQSEERKVERGLAARLAPVALGLVRSLLVFMLWSGVIAGLIALYALLVEPNRIVVEQATYETPSHRDPGREGRYRIAFISDLDMTGPPGWFARRVRRTINDLEPDLIAVGGDFFGGDDWEPDRTALAPFSEWLAGFSARDGMVVVWGEQEIRFAPAIRAVFPEAVRDLHAAAELRAAGDAVIRLVGPAGLFAPLSVEPARGGRVLAGWGRSLTVAPYRGEQSRAWSRVSVTTELSIGRVGDSVGLAVLEGERRPGYRFRVSPATSSWDSIAPGGPVWKGPSRATPAFVAPGQRYRARVEVDVGATANFVRSRIWPAALPEPAGWSIELIDDRDDRPQRGTVALLAGDSWHGSGRKGWEWVEVRDRAGRLLLRDEFDDPQRFAESWGNPGARPDDFDVTVLVGHDSIWLLDMPPLVRPPLDLVLAGHTHGGQVRLPLFGPLHLDGRLPRGWSMGFAPLPANETWLYTTRGLGVSKVPIRFLCPPEVTLMEILVRHRPPR